MQNKFDFEKESKKKENFDKFKDKAIDFEEGENFHKNVYYGKNVKVFYNKRSFILFRLIRVEDINTCYIYYMFGENFDSFKSCFYSVINFCLGTNVKFIYYSEKEKEGDFYVKFLENLGFKKENKIKKYKHNYLCKKCGGTSETCKCNTYNLYI